jgi:aminomethyltransferase
VGGPQRTLVGLTVVGRGIARHGYPILDPHGTTQGRTLGTVTSGTMSPTLRKAIAMGYVESAEASPGTMLDVDVRGAAVPAEVVALPFYKRPKADVAPGATASPRAART